MNRNDLELNWIDYILSALASVTVLLSAGISVRNNQAGYFFCAIALVGHLVAAFGPRVKGTWHRVTIDGVLFAGCAAACLAFSGELNRFVPDGGFPPQLMYTAGLCWVISLGSFLAWRDSTLLFLDVPAIALYGLIGAFDTFQFAPLMFFAFLVATGMLFARSHLRNMLRLAAQAGEADLYRLRRYAWKSLAGPEWALVSAVGVVAFSALGAPFIRNSVQDATAPLRVPLRPSTSNPASNIDPSGLGRPDPNRDFLRVGSGPYGRPSLEAVLVARMDAPRYLRGEAFYQFQENRWSNLVLGGHLVARGADGAMDLALVNPELVELGNTGTRFSYQLNAVQRSLPGPYFPGVLSKLRGSNPRSYSMRSDGILRISRDGSLGPTVSGESIDPDLSHLDHVARPGFWRESFEQVSLSDRVRKLVAETIKDCKTDFERAVALRRMVSQRITYNLQAAMIADGKDVVDAALFESHEGYCDVFATCLAMVAREAGLPSRLASGYLVTEDNHTRRREYVVRESDYHAWTEIYFAGAGWVTFDATEGAAEVEGFGRGDPWRAIPAWWETDWARQAGNALMLICVLGLAGVIFWDTAKRVIRRVKLRNEPVPADRSEWEAVVASALEGLEKASGLPRRFSETAPHYAHRLATAFPEASLAPGPMGNAIDRLLFADTSGDMTESIKVMEEQRAKISALKKARKSR